MTNLHKLVLEKYREDGLVSLVLSAPFYFKTPRWVVNSAFKRILGDPEPIPTIKEVQDGCAEDGMLWEYEGEFDADKIRQEVLSRQNSQQHGASDLFDVRKEGYDWSPRKVCELRDAAVAGNRGLVIDSNGKPILKLPGLVYPHYVKSLFYSLDLGTCFQVRKRQKGYSTMFGEPRRLENAMSMITLIDIYGHWLQNYLPMLLHLSVYEENTGREPDIIVDKDAPEWMFETLRVLGYGEDRIVEWDDGFVVVDRLVLPSASMAAHTPSRTRMSPVEYRWLRERFLESVDGTDTTGNERFYISRQGMKDPSGLSGERYITNFDEIKPVLDDFDIEVVRPETMSIEDQVRKFSRGGLFVGPRGSGLHNTLFAKNAQTVEIYTPNTRHHIQHLFDYALGHDWTYIIGSDYDKSTETEEDRNMPFLVNPDVLRAKLEEVLPDG